METTLKKDEPTPTSNGNSLAPATDTEEARLIQLKVAAYDTQKQIQFLTQVQMPDLERQIAELSQHLMRRPS